MVLIPGGEPWIGSPAGRGAEDEHPRFQARLAPFCLGETEVTVAAYAECVEAGACEPARSGMKTCTASKGTADLPINCVTWSQADAYCRFRAARLPSEAEWEYAASGGDDRDYSWGNEEPDGRTCWKKPGACAVRTYPAGAFGLYDMTGNLWEWTNDYYGSYPWPAVRSPTKVYRGGSWSRRFEKWMYVRLRNRWDPSKEGSHLGFRCAKTLDPSACPAGPAAGEGSGCRLAVLAAECPGKQTWNGVRCAAKGTPGCAPGYKVEPGHGCVLETLPTRRGKGSAGEEEESPVRKVRSPEFDNDCKMYQPSRPVAWRFEGGTHAGRNKAGGRAGCKNRDVGVGWNSACCPQ